MSVPALLEEFAVVLSWGGQLCLTTYLFPVFICMFVIVRMVEGRGVHRFLVGKPEGKRPLGRPRRTWEDNIKLELREVEEGGDWRELAQDRDRWRALVNTVMNLRIP